ncbi:MAG: DNA-directed RNA polymerase subunit beta [Fidelibacterota bacterium]|nr:MAG: DNA-directed RNA polymerase subunit beta [Candidatus Neomarinimicrobiota bacterium]
MSVSAKTTPERYSFTHISPAVDIPDLLAIQTFSYEEFLQEKVSPEKREIKGLEDVFRGMFSVEDSHGNYVLEYVSYYLGKPKYTVRECLDRGVSYTVPLRVRLILHITDEEDKSVYAQSIEQDVFFGNIPYMTDRGTFIINGAERIIVSQLQRSPGVFFEESKHPNGTSIYQARIIPFRGSWVDFTTDIYDCLYAIIDRRRKFPATLLLRAIGYGTNEDIFRAFGLLEDLSIEKTTAAKLTGRQLAADVVNTETGEIVAEAGKELIKEDHALIKKSGVPMVSVLCQDKDLEVEMVLNTLKKDPTTNHEDALARFYRDLRAGEAPSIDVAQKFVERMFFSPKKYDLGQVGRYRINKKFNLHAPVETPVLIREDFVEALRYLIEMRKGERGPDDIDHLGNRRVRTVGEQLSNQFSIALSRMQRTIRERMSTREAESLTPQDLINSRIVTSVLNAFFGTSQLSQFMDQTNPLSEITHKRRISSLGPGGLTRERAGFEVRDVHYTHYGRLCPIETPEGPNIGLISSLATHAMVNNLGFIESPYRIVNHSKGEYQITNNVEYLSADDEDRVHIAQANEPVKNGQFASDRVLTRKGDNFPLVTPGLVDYMDVAPSQIVSVAASLIPFLEHDDANRALMGSNMQRQSVPLLKPERPIVGTGVESRVAQDSRAAIYSDVDGTVESVEADHITIRTRTKGEDVLLQEEKNMRTFSLYKFLRTNQDTCINQKPLVHPGQKLKKGVLLADGCATDQGELALGRNLLVAFMPWRGYNFEDAIVINERLLKEDILTSIHIKMSEMEVRDTKRGAEELTNEIPNVSEEATRNLDINGIIRVGAEVKPGDILIGKVTPKGETDPTPEEKLLRAIFGEKAGDVKDTSKRCDSGVRGTVIKTQLFERKSTHSRVEDKQQIEVLQAQARKERIAFLEKRNLLIKQLMIGQLSGGIRDLGTNRTLIKAKTKLTDAKVSGLDFDRLSLKSQWVDDARIWGKILDVLEGHKKALKDLEDELERDIFKIRIGDELQPGVLKLAKVYIANKRKISVGDKMAGRHGNKGIVSVIVPEEDMPFMEDGTPVDIVLNPLGVPSRMNVGQLYETMLGWAGFRLNKLYSSPVFNGATIDEVQQEMAAAGLPSNGKVYLRDGRTGERTENPVTAGVIYMMKLSHQVDDKMHARSTGPYSLITQQPLGGKAQFGGQRFGEMEVWALEAYGAAYTLQELLTVKSDDVEGRSKLYNTLVKGENTPKPSMPESFNVLLKELQGLGLNITLD